MDQTAEEVREPLLAPRRVAERRLTPERQRQYLLGGIALLLTLLLISAVSYTRRYDDRVYRGVRVAGVDVGGLTREEAIARIDARTADWLKTPLPVKTADGSNNWAVFPYDLGITADSAAAADAALAYGRNGWLLGNVGRWFGALAAPGGATVGLPTRLDDAQLELVLRSWAPSATYAPINAVFSVASDGKLTIVADKDGRGFDLDSSRAAFLTQAGRLGDGPATLAQVAIPAPVTAAMLRTVDAEAQAVAGRSLVVRYADRSWTLPPATIARALGYRVADGQLVVALSADQLAPFFAELRAAIDKPSASAKLIDEGKGRYSLRPSQGGFALDQTATLAAIDAALQGWANEAQVVANPTTPPIVTADLEPVKARLDKITSLQMLITFEEYKRPLYPADIWPLIRLVEQPDKPEKVAIVLDPEGLRALSQLIAGDVNQGVRNAEFAFANGAVRDVVSSLDGRVVQLSATDGALRAAILGAAPTITPAVAVTKPQIPSSKKEEMATPDRLGLGRTDYSFSIPSRKHNVELAAKRLDGALIPPGATFSFNQQVGAQTVENGYKEAYGIALVPGKGGTPGEYKTVDSVAGGICQVSTTLFHGVFRAGLPIQERNHHLFWVTYAASRTGMLGLDATVDDQSGLDFQFINTTGGWMGIEAKTDGEVLQVAIYGKNPGWKVVIDDPVITNVRVPNPKPAYDKTHDLPPGVITPIEHATEGFDAAIRRRVFNADGSPLLYEGKAMDLMLRSRYEASRDRYQVGVPPSEPLDTPYVPKTGDPGNDN